MLEIPEAATIARQVRESVAGRTVVSAQAGHSPHGFAWYSEEDPAWYAGALAGQRLDGAVARAGYVELALGEWRLTLNDGVNLRLAAPGARRPARHQLLVELEDGSALVATVQMYGGLLLFEDGECDNPYYLAARAAPNPLTGEFTPAHLQALAAAAKPTLSAKALLATGQRIPGLGNGCLQDILFAAGVHPRRRVSTLGPEDLTRLHAAVVDTLRAMAEAGGRDTEKDLFARPGGYATVLSARTRALPCPRCGGPITRQSYLGGNVYFCPTCQPMP